MKVQKLLPILGLSVVLVGCGGGKSGNNPASDPIETTTIQAPTSDETDDISIDQTSEENPETEEIPETKSSEDTVEVDTNNN